MSYNLKTPFSEKLTTSRNWDSSVQVTAQRAPMNAVAVLFAITVGLCGAFYMMGPDAINPWNIDWLVGDPATHYLGWAFFRKTPDWFFPITWTDRLGYPWGVSISFLDSIPLVAVLLRPISSILGEPFQYIGLYACLCFILQAFFGFKIAYRIGFRNLISAGLTAVFFMLAPAFIWRFHGHFALASHWVILAAIYCYLREVPGEKAVRWLIPFWVLVAIAGAINPYIAVMTLLLTLAASARLWLVKRLGVWTALATAAASVGILAASFVIFGFYVGGGADAYAGGGYRSYSMNLLAPIDPHVYRTLLLPMMPINPGQYEGYNYLGITVIAFLAFGLLSRNIRGGAATKPDIFPLLMVGLISTLIAASTKITLGSFTIASIPLPEKVEQLAQMLRASGRLFWPAYYLLIIAAFASLTKIRRPIREIILVIGLLIQILDLMPLMASARLATHGAATETKLVDPVWNGLGERHAHLAVHPAWSCDSASTPDGPTGYRTFGMLADKENMTLNSYYAGRFDMQAFDHHCRQALEPIMAGNLDPETAYVLSDSLFDNLASKNIKTHRCSRVDGFNLCVRDTDNLGVRTEENYAVGAWIDFSSAGTAISYLGTGWSGAEPWGRWSDAGEAKFVIFPGKSTVAALEIDAQAFVTENDPNQTVNVFANGQKVGQIEFSVSQSQQLIKVPLPSALIKPNQEIEFRFEIVKPRSPMDVGLSSDIRKLGIGVRKLRLISSIEE
jgi:hypothetical protein